MKVLALRQFGKLSRYTTLVLRVIAGAIYAAHGKAKLNSGFDGTAGFFASQSIPAPEFMAYVITFLELIGGVLLIIGLGTRIFALLFAIEMIGTTLIVKLDAGMHLIAMQGAGAELDLALLGCVVAILYLGPGRYSVDDKIGLGDA